MPQLGLGRSLVTPDFVGVPPLFTYTSDFSSDADGWAPVGAAPTLTGGQTIDGRSDVLQSNVTGSGFFTMGRTFSDFGYNLYDLDGHRFVFSYDYWVFNTSTTAATEEIFTGYSQSFLFPAFNSWQTRSVDVVIGTVTDDKWRLGYVNGIGGPNIVYYHNMTFSVYAP